MARLTASALLEVWERGRSLHPIDRALCLVAAAAPELPPGETASLSLGERDARLLALREATFGRELPALADCPGCGERLEFDLSGADLRAGRPGAAGDLEHEGHRFGLRPLNSHDLAAVAGASSESEARVQLATRALLAANGIEMTPELVDALSWRLSEIDPQAEMLLALSCPECAHQWQLSFDIGAYLWREIEAEAQRLLMEVHTLARAYGWREVDILAMSATRRRAYVELVG